MNTKVKISAIATISLIVGYVVGSVFGIPPTKGNLGKGDISKVSRFNKASIENQTSAFEQELRNDTLALKYEVNATTLLTSRIEEFNQLLNLSIKAAEGLPEFQNEILSMKSLMSLSENASKTGKVATASLDKIVTGNDNQLAIDIEQASQNLSIAYLLIDRQVNIGKNFVIAADKYLAKNQNNNGIAFLRDRWMSFCIDSAALNEDETELAYWGKTKTLLSPEANLAIGQKEFANFCRVLNERERFVNSLPAISYKNNVEYKAAINKSVNVDINQKVKVEQRNAIDQKVKVEQRNAIDKKVTVEQRKVIDKKQVVDQRRVIDQKAAANQREFISKYQFVSFGEANLANLKQMVDHRLIVASRDPLFGED